SDGTNTQKLDLPDMGYVIDPAWSPNGQLLAFSWRRPSGNYDIYLMDVASRQIRELTRDQGRNERPSWAPDGRHLVFESTRGGSRQIWTMLADGSQPHQLTNSGHNESPHWSTRCLALAPSVVQVGVQSVSPRPEKRRTGVVVAGLQTRVFPCVWLRSKFLVVPTGETAKLAVRSGGVLATSLLHLESIRSPAL